MRNIARCFAALASLFRAPEIKTDHIPLELNEAAYQPPRAKRRRGKTKMTAWEHYCRDKAMGRIPFGRGVSRKRTILVVPELRKRRSERDPEVLARQMGRAW